MNEESLMGMEQEPEKGMCVKIYASPDGSYLVSKSEEPAPEDGQPAADMDEAMELAKQLMSGAPEGEDDMQSAQAGYDRKAKPMMGAPNPEGIFGE
jgi:hypothetical protein